MSDGAGGWGPDGEPCADKAGFLFSHRCGRMSSIRCSRCSKPICDKHAVSMPTGQAESEAEIEAQTESQPQAAPGEPSHTCVTCSAKVARKAKRRKARRDEGERDDYDDNPYFYSAYYYSDYGYYGPGSWGHSVYPHDHGASGDSFDSHDFSEADGASLHEGDDDFEHDMGAS